MTKTTITPVALSGWYEHTDGSVGYYAWCAGRISYRGFVANWDATRPTREQLDAHEARVKKTVRGALRHDALAEVRLARDGFSEARSNVAIAIARIAAAIKATISERGNGFPDVGDYVPGDGNLYCVVEMDGTIHTAGLGASNYVHALVELADWSDCEEGEEFRASVEIEAES